MTAEAGKYRTIVADPAPSSWLGRVGRSEREHRKSGRERMTGYTATLGDLDERGLERLPEFPAGPVVPPLDRCDACAAEIHEQTIADTIWLLLHRLSARQRQALQDTYQGATSPDMLCWPCFRVTVGVINELAMGKAA